jgi:anti-sigma B factor antagonist
MAAPTRIEVGEAQGVQVIRFRDRRLFDEPVVREATEEVFAALPPSPSPIRLILDFSGVELVSSTLIGRLVVLQRRVDASGGRLRLCELGRGVESVMRTTNLDRLFQVDRDRRAALEAF